MARRSGVRQAARTVQARKPRGTYKVVPALYPHLVKLEELKPDPGNARRHPDEQIGDLVVTLGELGQHKPIVTRSDGTIIAGEGVYRAAEQLQWSHVAAIKVQEPPKRSKARALADNKIAERSTWDEDALSAQLVEIEEPGLLVCTGFSSSEIEELLELPAGSSSSGDESERERVEFPAKRRPRIRAREVWGIGFGAGGQARQLQDAFASWPPALPEGAVVMVVEPAIAAETIARHERRPGSSPAVRIGGPRRRGKGKP